MTGAEVSGHVVLRGTAPHVLRTFPDTHRRSQSKGHWFRTSGPSVFTRDAQPMNSQPRKPSVLPGRVTGGVTSVVDADLLLLLLHSPILRFAAAAGFFAPTAAALWCLAYA